MDIDKVRKEVYGLPPITPEDTKLALEYSHKVWMEIIAKTSSQQSVQRTAGTWRKILNFVGRVAGSLRRR